MARDELTLEPPNRPMKLAVASGIHSCRCTTCRVGSSPFRSERNRWNPVRTAARSMCTAGLRVSTSADSTQGV